ncbi:hypothetical protein CEK60_08065 [Halomonas sp. N3-2A]|nr:hypothetical protein CEK60_08065 [Halomonas sp. N3-2A]
MAIYNARITGWFVVAAQNQSRYTQFKGCQKGTLQSAFRGRCSGPSIVVDSVSNAHNRVPIYTVASRFEFTRKCLFQLPLLSIVSNTTVVNALNQEY